MHNLYTKRDAQRLSSLSPFSVVGFPFPWHAGGNVWVCGGSVEKCWYTWRLQLQLTCTLNIFFFFISKCKLWKAAGYSDFVFHYYTQWSNWPTSVIFFFFFFRSMLNPLSSAKLLLSPPPAHFNKSLLYMFGLFLVLVWSLNISVIILWTDSWTPCFF